MKIGRKFVLSELYAGCGGMKCERPGCSKRTFTIYLKPEDKLPGDYGPEASLAALKLGEALCDQHASEKGKI